MVTAKECLQTGDVCRALARKTKELDIRAALLEFAYEFRTVAKLLEREERKLMASKGNVSDPITPRAHEELQQTHARRCGPSQRALTPAPAPHSQLGRIHSNPRKWRQP
jgi:hypothetical protein